MRHTSTFKCFLGSIIHYRLNMKCTLLCTLLFYFVKYNICQLKLQWNGLMQMTSSQTALIKNDLTRQS